jgi:hypothetical protein
MAIVGSIILRQHRFIVSTDLSSFYSLIKGLKVWIRIFDLEYDMRGYQSFAAVTQPFGNLLDLDFNTRVRLTN